MFNTFIAILLGQVDPNSPGELITTLTDLLKDGDGSWQVIAGIIVLLAVWGTRLVIYKTKFADKLKTKYLKWIAVALATLTTVAVGLVDATPETLSAWFYLVFKGVGTGLTAVGIWQFGGKTLHEKVIPVPETEPEVVEEPKPKKKPANKRKATKKTAAKKTK